MRTMPSSKYFDKYWQESVSEPSFSGIGISFVWADSCSVANANKKDKDVFIVFFEIKNSYFISMYRWQCVFFKGCFILVNRCANIFADKRKTID